MGAMRYSFPARFEADENGRLVVHFPDLPEALTDGADEAEALAEASDCLSEALAGRIRRREQIPIPSPPGAGVRVVEPEPTIALQAALYEALRRQGLGPAELGKRLGVEEHQAARLIDPKARIPLAKLEQALAVLGYSIAIEVHDRRVA